MFIIIIINYCAKCKNDIDLDAKQEIMFCIETRYKALLRRLDI